ncbi:MAG: acyltransferase family protein [Corynebacterium sp.]|nr:acyltransferase family protein [Corynebacterium sp.]
MRAQFPHLRGLDGLRGLAVLAVVAYHFFGASAPGGFLGVDIFFVLSGFLICSLLIDESRHSPTSRPSLRGFWMRRFRRIVPVASFVLIVVVALAGAVGGDLSAGIAPQFFGSFLFVNNWVQVAQSQSYFSDTVPHIFGHYWSLGVEEQFYLIFPFIFLGFCRRGMRGIRALGWVAIVGALLSTVSMAVGFDPQQDPSRLYFGTDTHAMGLLLGVALAALLSSNREGEVFRTFSSPRARNFTAIAGLAALIGILCCVLWMHSQTAFTFRGGFLLASILTAVVVFAVVQGHYAAPGSLAHRFNYTLLGNSVLRSLGRWSFSIYLWHWPVWIFLTHTTAHPQWQHRTIAVAATCIISYLSWRYVELPASRFIGRPRRPIAWEDPREHNRVAYRVIMSLLVVISLGGAVVSLAHSNRPTLLEQQLAANEAKLKDKGHKKQNHPTTGVWAMDELTGEDMTAVGDSVMLASVDKLYEQFPGIYIDAAVSRGMPGILETLQTMAEHNELRPVVVLGVGTNDEVEPFEIAQVMRIVGPERLLVLTAPHGDRPWIADSIPTIFRAAKRYPNVVVADWNGAAIANPQTLAWDGIHPDGEGAYLYAREIRLAMDYFLQIRAHK